MEAIKLLLQYGADLNRVDETGMTPINLAKSIGMKEYVEIFEQEDGKSVQQSSINFTHI
jgi:ankyrin repeat protein